MSSVSLDNLVYGYITETISVTYTENKGYNIAPIGVIKKNDGKTYARFYRGSDTIENVKKSNEIIINFTRDPVVFAEGSLSDRADEKIKNGRLEGADAWVKCYTELNEIKQIKTQTDKKTDKSKKEEWILKEKEGKILKKRVFSINRGFNAIIEATIYATRLKFNSNFKEKVDHYIKIAKKCGGERERKAAKIIKELIDK